MNHSEAIHQAAKAAFEEYQRIDREHVGMITWDDLADDSKANWAAVARVVINTYNEWK